MSAGVLYACIARALHQSERERDRKREKEGEREM
jgi:hypothetical protein